MAAKEQFIDPDVDFIRHIIKTGGDGVKKCFQCATCTGVCPISPESQPFPRKEMLWVQWGLKDRLLQDPDIWLCYQCMDCSEYCPRSGHPGDVLAAVRKYSIDVFSVPRFLARMVPSPRYLPLLFGIPVALFLILLGITGHLRFPDGPIVFSKFVPHLIVDPVFIIVSLLALGAAFVAAKRYWDNLAHGIFPLEDARDNGNKPSLAAAFTHAVIEVLRHNRFKECSESKFRYLTHLAIFYGFVALFIVTTIVFFGIYLFGLELPMHFHHPVKLFANLGAIFLFGGLTVAVFYRFTNQEKSGKNTYYDWLFLLILYAVTVSGILTEVARLMNHAEIAYSIYFIHLVTIFFLIAYFPYSKFAHVVFRTVAIAYANMIGRKPSTETRARNSATGCAGETSTAKTV